jgi:hypothetical protein
MTDVRLEPTTVTVTNYGKRKFNGLTTYRVADRGEAELLDNCGGWRRLEGKGRAYAYIVPPLGAKPSSKVELEAPSSPISKPSLRNAMQLASRHPPISASGDDATDHDPSTWFTPASALSNMPLHLNSRPARSCSGTGRSIGATSRLQERRHDRPTVLICRRFSAILECATLINSQEIHTVELTEEERAAPDGRTLCPDCFDDRVEIARLRRLRDGAWTRFCALPRYVNASRTAKARRSSRKCSSSSSGCRPSGSLILNGGAKSTRGAEACCHHCRTIPWPAADISGG